MFGSYRRKLLATLLLRAGERYHVRELGRMTGISAGSVHRELKVMAESGLLLREHVGNQVLYQANQDCPIYQELAAIFRKTIGLADLLHDALEDLADKILVFRSTDLQWHGDATRRKKWKKRLDMPRRMGGA